MMDANELRKKVRKEMFEVCVILDACAVGLEHEHKYKGLEYRPGHSEQFRVVTKYSEVWTTTKFTDVNSAIDFYVSQPPR